jgi:hypothetical protein
LFLELILSHERFLEKELAKVRIERDSAKARIAELEKNGINSNLTKMAAINFYKSTGLTDAEIFEAQTQSA